MGFKSGKNIGAKTICKGFAFIAFLFLFVAARPACRPPPNLDCIYFSVTVQPGTCVDIQNPCFPDGSWADVEHFRFYDEPDGLFIRGRSGAGGTVDRQICAADTVELFVDEEVSYLYTKINRRRRPDYGEGFVYVSTFIENLFEATASAVPANIFVGDTSQLDVTASGGTLPYTYVWMSDPAGQIAPGDTTLQNPVVSPTVDTEYTVAVTDNEGDVTTDSVTVRLGMRLSVSATPDRIDLGQSAQLEALVEGGAPPYTFSWVPLSTLDDSTLPNPTATPVNTTLYEVTVTDIGTSMVVDTVSVGVNMQLTVSATPGTIAAGDSSQLDVSITGGKPPFTYLWDPADGLDSNHESLKNPVVTPSAPTTYNVVVTDADDETAHGSVAVTVDEQPALEACFTVTPDPPNLGQPDEEWDAGCSTGSGLAYRWVFDILGTGQNHEMCFGRGPVGGYIYDSPCAATDEFSPALQTLTFGLEGPSGYTRRATLYMRDAAGNIDFITYDWNL